MLNQEHLGLIGYGSLGKDVHRRLSTQDTEITSTIAFGESEAEVKKNRALMNSLLAEKVDLLILTVQPNKVNEVIAQIQGRLKKGAEVLSLVAAYPQNELEAKLDFPVSRGMTDLQGFGSILLGGTERTVELMNRLSVHPTVLTEKEEEIDKYTICVGCLPGIAAWHFEKSGGKQTNALEDYLQFLIEEKGMNQEVVRGIVKRVQQEGNFEGKLKHVATGKGVTSAMVAKLVEGNHNPHTVFEAGRTRIEEMKIESCAAKA